jgi:hypothetical protein
MIKKILSIIGAVMALAAFVGLCYQADNRYVHQTAMAASEARIGKMEDRVRLRELEPVVWRLETMFQGKKMPPEVQAEYERVRSEKVAIEKRLGIR